MVQVTEQRYKELLSSEQILFVLKNDINTLYEYLKSKKKDEN